MPSYEVNQDGVRHARTLIDEGKVDTETEWWQDAPSASEENDEIDDDGFAEFARWHLAINPDAGERTKGRFRFPYGDFQTVNRAAVIHAKSRAAQNDHDAVEKAADELLQRIDNR